METRDIPPIPQTRAARTTAEQLLFLVAACMVVLTTFVAARLTLSTRTGTVDSYYYFARAASLNEGASLLNTTINWGEGVDRKFFPGFPLFLHWFSFGSAPERAWRTLAVVMVLVNPILMGFGLRRIGLGFGASCAAVALFCSSFVPLNWMTMPMAESTALLWLCLSAIALPVRGDPIPKLYTRFLLTCLLGGMAILTRAEAAYVAGMLGLVGVNRIWKARGWLFVAAAGVILGAAPFGVWVGSLPPSTEGGSRLHYVNEFFKNFSFRDSDDGFRGGMLDNFLRSCWHPVFNWGRVPFMSGAGREHPLSGEFPAIRALWMALWLSSLALGLAGFGGKHARRFALAFLGFLCFRSLWYYPYDRFLVTGLPMGFAAAALLGENLSKQSRGWAIGVGVVFALWVFRGTDNFLEYHAWHRIPENGAHTYRDDRECLRLQYQMQYTRFPLEGADVAVLAGQRFTKKMASEAQFEGNPTVKRREKVALEFPWPQICYALRPRPIVLGYPFENFWGPEAYRRFETVPQDLDGVPVRAPRSAHDFLEDERVRYVITPLALTAGRSLNIGDQAYGTWLDRHGFEPREYSVVHEIDTVSERFTEAKKYEWPQFVHIYELRFPEKPVSIPADSKDK